MNRCMWVCLALLVVGVPASAQLRQYDISAFGWQGQPPRLIDTDGNPETEEWLIEHYYAFVRSYQVVAIRNGVVCRGDLIPGHADWRLQSRHGRSVLVRMEWPILSVLTLVTPSCG